MASAPFNALLMFKHPLSNLPAYRSIFARRRQRKLAGKGRKMQQGGKTVYGAAVGILMLETQYQVVRGDPTVLLDAFVAAGRDLVETGCDGITTNCGFLSLLQEDVKAALGVPVATSSLMQIPMVQAMLPKGQRVGVLTISKATLTEAHLAAAGAPLDTPVVGTDGGRCFTRDILGDAAAIDFDACRLDMEDAARALMAVGGIGAIVLECTNMVPYAQEIRRITGVPVYSIVSLVNWFQAGLLPAGYAPRLQDPRWG